MGSRTEQGGSGRQQPAQLEECMVCTTSGKILSINQGRCWVLEQAAADRQQALRAEQLSYTDAPFTVELVQAQDLAAAPAVPLGAATHADVYFLNLRCRPVPPWRWCTSQATCWLPLSL